MSDLSGTLPALSVAFGALQAYAAAYGIAIGVADDGGVRTAADTARILAERQADFTAAVARGEIDAGMSLDVYRPISPFGSSYHNYGAAVDVEIQSQPSGMTEPRTFALLGAYAPLVGLIWGGTFTNADPDHFELAMSLPAAQAAYQAMTGDVAAGDSSGDDAELAQLAATADGEDLDGGHWGYVALGIAAVAAYWYFTEVA